MTKGHLKMHLATFDQMNLAFSWFDKVPKMKKKSKKKLLSLRENRQFSGSPNFMQPFLQIEVLMTQFIHRF
jgi:hypothetical protein